MMTNTMVLRRLGPQKWQLVGSWQTPFATVPCGFITDGASVPRVFWWFISPSGSLFEAAVLHDYCYKKGFKTKAYADTAFYKMARRSKVNIIKAKIAYFAVRLFGKGNY